MQPLFSSFSIKDIQSLNPDVVVLATGSGTVSRPAMPKQQSMRALFSVAPYKDYAVRCQCSGVRKFYSCYQALRSLNDPINSLEF